MLSEKAPIPTIAIRPTKLDAVLLICLALMFVAVGLFAAGEDKLKDVLARLVFILFGCGLILFGLRAIISNTPIFVVSEAGIYVRRLGIGTVPWSDITGVHLISKTMARETFICLELRNLQKWVDQLSLVNRIVYQLEKLRGLPLLYISAAALRADAERVLEIIQNNVSP